MAQRTKGRSNGEGTIYEAPKGSGIWYAQVSLPDSKRRKRRADSQREAREKLKQLQAEIDQGVDLSAQQPTVAEWCRTWLTTFATNLKPNIRDDYHGILRRYIDSAPLGKRRLDKLTAAEVQQAWVSSPRRCATPTPASTRPWRWRGATPISREMSPARPNCPRSPRPPSSSLMCRRSRRYSRPWKTTAGMPCTGWR